MPPRKLRLSVVIPAHNEEDNIEPTVEELIPYLKQARIPHEIIIVNDNSTDSTSAVLRKLKRKHTQIRQVNRKPPGGFGRAIRSGLEAVSGDVVIIVMADRSDDAADVVKYYRKIEEGYDCVFGSRWMKGTVVKDFPPIKLFFNRIVNRVLQLMFWTSHNDLTNAFKAYRTHVIHEISPLLACHFNITIELSLSALIRRYKIARVPINWYGRTWGESNLKLRQMGRRYLATLLKIWFERILIFDDVMAEKESKSED